MKTQVALCNSAYTAYRLTTSSSTSMPRPGLVGTAIVPSRKGTIPGRGRCAMGFRIDGVWASRESKADDTVAEIRQHGSVSIESNGWYAIG